MSDHCFKSDNIDSGGSKLCTDDTILEEKCGVEDDGACQHPKSHISEADNELSFLDNDGWLDIGNLEDVDRMLSCDLTFGMGSLNNEEEFCWFSSSHSAEGSDDALMSDLKLHCTDMSPLKNISEYNMDSSKDNIEVLPINDSNKKSFPSDKKTRSQMGVDDNGVPASLSMFNESDEKSSHKDVLVSKEKKKLPKSSAGKRKNDNSVHCYTPPEQYGDINQRFGASSSGVTSLDSNQKHNQNTDYDSLGCILTQIPLTHLDFSHAPSHTSVSSNFSGPRVEHDGYMSPLIESSYASNMDCSHGHSLVAAALRRNENKEKYHSHGNLLDRSYKNERRANEMPFHSPGSSQQESSPISSALDQNSFCNLQQVLEQLDIRTKLCIRDSLYRLAKSAEQRDINSNSNGCIGDGTEACKDTMAQDASRCTGLMDIETNTNPIDRSIAHLLFHRPSHPSTLLQNDIAPFKSSAMIHESTINPPVKAEKQVCQEDDSSNVEKKLLGGNV
ncbi:hypothetical protein TSUD_389160 [Trifolium subterraneum]|uniref:Protein LNK1 n=1 Tax=Trifolium subterraneum TaxID=3900 RepID=A0A2Z6NVQ0_TRISU|nr:hypothetical protein TSUD_389160 [Trifolium subterraneum]